MRTILLGFVLLTQAVAGWATTATATTARIIYALPYDDAYRAFQTYDLAMGPVGEDAQWLFLNYEVPPDLIGQAGRFMTMVGRIDGEGTFVQLDCSETGSEARCARSGDRLACSVKFRSLEADPIQVEAFLRAKYGEDGNLAARLAAAKSFSGDAVGTMDVLLQQSVP